MECTYFYPSAIKYKQWVNSNNRWVSQIWELLVACCEIVVDCNRLPEVLYVFEHKTWYISMHAPYTHIVIFGHISNIPQEFCRVKIVMIPYGLYSNNICEIWLYIWDLVVTTMSQYTLLRLLWANIHYWGCSPVGEKSCEIGLLHVVSSKLEQYIHMKNA